MTRFTDEQYRCSACNALQDFRCYTEINVTSDPQLKDDVLRGRIFESTCSACGKVNFIPYPLLYIDEEKKLLFFLVQGAVKENPLEPLKEFLRGQGDEASLAILAKLDSFTVRVVESPNALSEKIQICDHHRDDHILEMMKVLMRGEIARKAPDLKINAMYYTPDKARNADRFSIETDEGFGNAVDVYEDLYKGIETEVLPHLSEEEMASVTVNEDWAFRAMGYTEKKEGEPKRS